MAEDFDKRLAEARLYEVGFAAWLTRCEWSVVAMYDFSGSEEKDQKPPKLKASKPEDFLTLPDLLACKNGVSKWFEVKTKFGRTFGRISREYETGLSLRHFLDYRKVKKRSGLEVWLAFIHVADEEVRVAEIDALSGPGIGRVSKINNERMVFFRWNSLLRVASISDIISVSRSSVKTAAAG